MTFSELNLIPPLLRAVTAAGYTEPTPIQAQAIPHVLAGRDVLGSAQTGTGKTAAFALPILQRLTEDAAGKPRTTQPRCLILCPTRELATQIAEDFRTYGAHLKLRNTTIFGGVSQYHQVTALRRGVDILIATPGRLLDLMQQGHIDLRAIQVLVLDEADRMLDMGFINDLRKIVAEVPSPRQSLLFSATMPAEIRDLAHRMLHNPAVVQVAATSRVADRVEQTVIFVEHTEKADKLADLITNGDMTRAIVFTRTKHGADRLVKQLRHRNIASEAIHGNKTQNARQRALDNFRRNRVGVLVATDVAARGIDVDNVSHVVNYDLTHEPETYVHRIGRTARAGEAGMAVSFCSRDELANLRAIERLLKQSIPVTGDKPHWADASIAPTRRRPGFNPNGQGQGQGQPGGRPRRRRHKPHHAAGASTNPHPTKAGTSAPRPLHPTGGSHQPHKSGKPRRHHRPQG